MTDRDLRGAVNMRVRQSCGAARHLAAIGGSLFGSPGSTALGGIRFDAVRILANARDRKHTIYGLVANDEPERVRYVGRTAHPTYRFAAHLQFGSVRVSAWLNDLRNRGAYALMVEIERCGQRPAWHRELYWIKHYRAGGMADLNVQEWGRAS